MPNTLQEFLAQAAQKAAGDLEAAVLRLPEDKRSWSPMGDARTALDQAAECAIVNGSTADLIESREWPRTGDYADFQRAKTELARDWEALRSLLQTNTSKVTTVIRAIPNADLGIEVQLPWGPSTLAQIASYPYWNMAYHEGQINYIASMLGCLKDWTPS